MTLQQLMEALRPELPKAIASGLLVPFAQFLATHLWNFRKRTRTSTIREQITKLDGFIAAQRARVQDATTEQIICDAELERVDLVRDLERAQGPPAASHRWFGKLTSVHLFKQPPFVLSYVMRVVLVSVAFVDVRTILIAWNGKSLPLWTWAALLIGTAWFYWLTRVVDHAAGTITERPRWRRLLLFYPPRTLTSGVAQVFYWILVASVLLTPIAVMLDGEEIDQELLWLLAANATLGSFYWWIAVHLDRTTGRAEESIARVAAGHQ